MPVFFKIDADRCCHRFTPNRLKFKSGYYGND